MKVMKILITGPQGSGKTTQAQLLADKLGLSFASAGALLREEAEKDTIEGRSLKEDMEAGKLVDDSLAAKILRGQLGKPQYQKGFVLDGYPREFAQLKHFDPEFNIVFYLDVPDEVVKKRLVARGREDDTPEIIEERLAIYHRLTEPVLDYYKDQNKLIKVDGTKSIKEVAGEIAEKFAEKMAYQDTGRYESHEIDSGGQP